MSLASKVGAEETLLPAKLCGCGAVDWDGICNGALSFRSFVFDN